MEKPAVVFALTVLSILPSVFATPVPPAFQFHATYVLVFILTWPPAASAPRLKPSESNAVKEAARVVFPAGSLDISSFVTPLIVFHSRLMGLPARDADLYPLIFQRFFKPVSVITPVGEQPPRLLPSRAAAPV